MIEKEFGRPILNSTDCNELRQAIFSKTKRLFGLTTVKRMFGLINDPTENRADTYNHLAMYLGYRNLRDMELDLGDTFDISMFGPVGEIDTRDLSAGTRIRITYDPKRVVEMTCLGDCLFRVDYSEKSKLEADDILKITHLAKGLDLIVVDVERAGYSLGEYRGAKSGGLTSIEII